MTGRDVRLGRRARADLAALVAWIAEEGSPVSAVRYGERLRDYCGGLADFPERGEKRDDLLPGLRLLGFERRVTVAFTVTARTVLILRLLYGGRDVEAAFHGQAPHSD